MEIYSIDDFLDEASVRQLYHQACDEKENFVPTTTVTGAVDYRQSTSLTSVPYYIYEAFRTKIHSLLSIICLNLLHPDFDVDYDGYECHFTRSGDGDFYKSHNDNGSPEIEKREITFVYYLHSKVKRFTGGDLELQCDHGPMYIEPRRNTIIFFESSRYHQVLPVSIPEDRFENGRFTINGWVRRK